MHSNSGESEGRDCQRHRGHQTNHATYLVKFEIKDPPHMSV